MASSGCALVSRGLADRGGRLNIASGVGSSSRYGTFFLGTAAGCIFLAWLYTLIAVGIYWTLRHFQQKASNKALATS